MAIRFMQRNLARQLSAGEIAVAAGTSERSLRRQFQRFTGQSPIAFHRHMRLEAARNALCDNNAKADITTAAGMHGFSHLSHFTGQYRRRYGELPSATLRALRESSLPLHFARHMRTSKYDRSSLHVHELGTQRRGVRSDDD